MIGGIVVAGGTGERFGTAEGKQLAIVAGAPLVSFSLRALAEAPSVETVVLVCQPERLDAFRHIAEDACGAKLAAVVPGGDSRAASVRAGIAALPKECDTVIIHDGARPLVVSSMVEEAVAILASAPEVDGVVVGNPTVDTIKVVEGGRVSDTPPRETLWLVHTPQVFRTGALVEAHERALSEGFAGTDDASLVERAGGSVLALEGPRWNIKVTVPEDLVVVETLLTARMRA